MEKSKFLKLKKSLPESPGIYKFLKRGNPIYVGKAVNLKNRLESYFSINLSPKTANMVREADRIVFIKVTNELEALLLEAKLIKELQPKYNFIAKDDKHALYIKIFDYKYPIIRPVRKNDLEDNLAIFGPFPSSQKVYSVLRFLRRSFHYADHKIGKRPCIYSQIGLCSPCPNLIESLTNTSEQKKLRIIYRKNISKIEKVLNGDIVKVITDLEKEMKTFSRLQKFEEATFVRNQIESLKYITQKRILEETFLENPNLSEDIKMEELDSLSKILKINNLKRIECFDISHISGYLATASMVTFIDAEADKSLYRKFKVKKSKNSDVAVMSEIAKRRIKYLDSWGKPDLIFVDGGHPQANAFKKIFDKYSIPVFPITKGREVKDFPDVKALNLVTRIRDESHRFAKKYHSLLFKNNLIRI